MTKKMNNLSTRVIVALIGVPLIVILSLIGKIPFLIFTLGIGLVSYYEFSKMVRNKHSYTNRFIGYLAVALIIINEYKNFFDYRIFFICLILLLLLFELFRNKESAIANLGTTLLGIFYIGFFSAAILDLREFYNDSAFTYAQGGYLIISILVSIWICDSAAYFIGSAYGLHKLMPRVSPNKSWEGAVAGFFFAIVGMIAARELVLAFLTMKDAIAIGVIVGIFGQLGDLVESLLKRDSHVKDSSSLIPGHGGIFDRFDSLLFTAPIVYLYLTFFTK
ncbi:MAG: phosphatidate cytidylyltransferase [Ignavibacteriales bacterium]|nr:phosphatidate cytidylyltransferase [Ignavibacteriales bacterium]